MEIKLNTKQTKTLSQTARHRSTVLTATHQVIGKRWNLTPYRVDTLSRLPEI